MSHRLGLCLALIIACAAAAAFPPMWPAPMAFTNGTSSVLVDSTKFAMTTTCKTSADLSDGFARFLSRAFPHKAGPTGVPGLKSISVCLVKESEPLELYMNENYTLTITATSITVHCGAVYGCYHALETLSQLIWFNFDTMTYGISHVPWVITDGPRFPHRGLLIDSSRHFLPVPTIKRIIESVTYAKINAIHWHIVDAIAFPFDSPTYPQLGKMGAYSAQERFTAGDVAEVVEFARKRGIRVMVELDTPGHSGSMCYGMPSICPNPLCSSSNINNWALDNTKNLTYTVVGGVLADLAKLFPEQMTHLGGDEVDTDCWAAHPYIMEWLSQRGLSLNGGYEYYVKRVQAIAWALNRTVVGWQEIWEHFGTSLDKRTIIHQWLANSYSLPLNVTSHGYRLIWSDSSRWYLDHLSVTWQQMYDAEPCNNLPDANCKLILGGEGCQWGETVDTSDAEQTIWPRLGAIAERLWSPRSYTSATAESRFIGFRCLLNRRSVAAAPALNAVARTAPSGPGSCFDQ